MDEPATAILHTTPTPADASTQAQVQMTGETEVLRTGTDELVVQRSRGFDKRLLAVPIFLAIAVLLLAGCSAIALLALVPMYLAGRDRAFLFLTLLQVAVLLAAASGWMVH